MLKQLEGKVCWELRQFWAVTFHQCHLYYIQTWKRRWAIASSPLVFKFSCHYLELQKGGLDASVDFISCLTVRTQDWIYRVLLFLAVRQKAMQINSEQGWKSGLELIQRSNRCPTIRQHQTWLSARDVIFHHCPPSPLFLGRLHLINFTLVNDDRN